MDESPAAPNLDGVIASLIEGAFDPKKLTRVERVVGNGVAWGQTVAHGAVVEAIRKRGDEQQSTINDVTELAEKAIGYALAHLVGHMLGIEVPPSAISDAGLKSGESIVGKAVGETVLEVLKVDGGELVPGEHGAVRLLGSLSGLAIKSWFEAVLAEEATSLAGILHPVEKIGDLARDLIAATGIDELGRLALRPLGLITVATPLEWQANKTYRPKLLPPAEAVRQALRGVWSDEQVTEELARQGYSDDRIDALFNAAAKFVSLSDSLVLERVGVWTRDQVVQNLRDQGYSNETASQIISAELLRRIDGFQDDSLSALKRAYADSLIDERAFQAVLNTVIRDPVERTAITTAADVVRGLNIKVLSRGDVERAVKLGVLGMVDYRATLKREGYSEDDSLVLEILLRSEIDKDFQVDKARAAAIAQRAAAQAARDAAALERKKQLDAERALHRRGALADLTRAVVRGIVPIARLVEVLNVEYDQDTVAILVRLAETDRQTFLEQQQAAADAKQRAAIRAIDVGALEQAVLEHVITVQDFRTRLEQLKFTPADAQVLTATLAARLADLTAAKHQRDAAAAAAKIKSIDLGRFEHLVRRGHRSMADYDALLRSLGFEDASRAAMRELLQIQIDDDAAADAARKNPPPATEPTAPTLEQIRRGVILGLIPESIFEQFLVRHNFTSDAQQLLLAELRSDVAAAEDARQRRADADAARTTPALPLSTVARAARLGIVSPAVYQARLVHDGYSADDVALEMDLLVQEIADVQAARRAADAADAAAGGKGLTLAELAIAVKRQLKHLEDYRARATELGLSADAVVTLVRVLGDELADTDAAKARRAEIAGELTKKGISLADRDAAVKEGRLSIVEYTDSLERDGYAPEDAELLTALLVDELTAVPA